MGEKSFRGRRVARRRRQCALGGHCKEMPKRGSPYCLKHSAPRKGTPRPNGTWWDSKAETFRRNRHTWRLA